MIRALSQVVCVSVTCRYIMHFIFRESGIRGLAQSDELVRYRPMSRAAQACGRASEFVLARSVFSFSLQAGGASVPGARQHPAYKS